MSSKKGVLGKGLSALLPSDDEERAEDTRDRPESGGDLSQSKLYRFEDRRRMVGRVADVEVRHIRPNPYQPRQEFSEEALDELAASIGQLGIIQPITVRAMGEGQFEVISGERRLRAARRAGLGRIPAYVREAGTEEMLEMALVENVQREELNPIEVALGYQRLIEEVDLTQAEVAKKVSKNRTTVSNFLRLLKLPPRVQAALRDGSVSVGHARALITLDDESVQRRILNAIEEDDLTVRAVEERVRDYRRADEEPESGSVTTTPASPSETEATAPSREEQRAQLALEEYKNRLRSALSTQVQITHGKDDEGQIKIDYYSAEDLERLLDLLT